MNILLVDDKPANLLLLRTLLEREAHTVACAANGEEALALAGEARPDLVISDILMPVMDGFALCRAWMQDPARRTIPFVFYTASYRSAEDEAFAISLGASAFLRKPMEQKAFIARIQRAVDEVQHGIIQPAAPAPMDSGPFLKLYNERLVHKLDEQSFQLAEQLAALQQSEATLRLKSAALEAAVNAIVITDPNGTILWGNAALATLTGYSLAELGGENLSILRPGAGGEALPVAAWEAIRAGRTWQGEMVNQRKDGTLYTEEMTMTPIVGEQGEMTHLIAIKWDVTEARRIEAELRHAQKMEAVGRLAGGVAHDFNNMLSVILLNTELSLLDADLPERQRVNLLAIQEAGRRSSNLTRQLLAFSRVQPVSQRKLDLNQVVSEDLTMMHRLVGEEVDLTFTRGAELWSVLMDPSQVSQILANLVINARDAMANCGTIAIATANMRLAEAAVFGKDRVVPGDYVVLTVSDTGSGMDAATLDHAFEPFFTTKPEGKGTGLGLSTVYGIVKQNHGALYARSHPGVGTTMKIFLPRFTGESMEPAHSLEATAPTGTETVLVVEDEPAVLDVMKCALENLGYNVLVASTPQDACCVAERHAGPIHLLLTDVVMSGMHGKDLRERVLTWRPDIKTLFMSGYTADIVTARGLLQSSARFLQKPFSVLDLAKTVRETIDGP